MYDFFWGVPNYFPKRPNHFTFPPTVYKVSNFYISLPILVIFWFVFFYSSPGIEPRLQQWKYGILTTRPPESSPCFSFFIVAILVSVRWYFILALICISQKTTDAEYLLMYLLIIWISSLEKCLFKILCLLLNWVVNIKTCLSSYLIYEVTTNLRKSKLKNWQQKEYLETSYKFYNYPVCDNFFILKSKIITIVVMVLILSFSLSLIGYYSWPWNNMSYNFLNQMYGKYISQCRNFYIIYTMLRIFVRMDIKFY